MMGRFACIFVLSACCMALLQPALLLAADISAASADATEPFHSLELPRFTDADRSFWSFQPINDLDVPEVDDTFEKPWCNNGIDRFVLQKLRSAGLTPAPEAERRTLARRVYFDLVGLPPTPEELDAFVADDSPTAYGDLVDRLLASPHYGERWGRHWLDLVRYAESHGHGGDQYRPTAWRYRDYVVSAFNQDKPYDRFIIEQLAGDEVAPGDPVALTATGFLRHWTYENNQRQTYEVREVILNDVTDTTGDVFLGLGLGCARCHDHKFDPILQKDYFRLQSFFAALLPRDDIPVATPEQIAAYQQQQARWEELTEDVRSKLSALEAPVEQAALAKAFKLYPQEIKDMYRKPDGERTPLEQLLVALVQSQLDDAKRGSVKNLQGEAKEQWEALQQRLAEFDEVKPKSLPYAMVVADIGPVAPLTYLPGKGEPVQPGFLSLLEEQPLVMEPPSRASLSTGRRAALARWIASADNPFTARVMVNRVWQHHFGRGLVGTPSDFGRLGTVPTHPELLDWLASRLIEGGWRLKQLHRLILTSATYRQSSLRPAPELAHRADPENLWLWRMSVRRLEAEPLRDAMLAVSGELDTAIGGPSVETSAPRRTIYTKVMRYTPDPLLRAFDAPDGFHSICERDQSTTPTQALMLVNGEWTLQRARALAQRLARLAALDDPERLVWLAYRLCFGRSPTPVESATVLAFLEERSRESMPDERLATDTRVISMPALVDLCHVLLNSNEFLYVD